ncbi:hypothetical protein [Romboutsia lituseburensis]|uniref:Uncharacterized protein n=1 Tax=Romboutsia lituseburensis DSM 797 TaxID=1121325 RepID=A0A1G9ILH5_9FIRM|nr:hypothetical protein [Romboutsia lituseburensis]MCR8743750.1 hypothetical protein [Romboutsia lituseburensis]CEH33846.1 Hypothetical protein RLITU_1252 [Romboutsia lituseburensis]SDL25977.1 hypothetical protein SAMN04515677_101296 [Romboutsia lituseburensis DSM 797]
MIKKIGLIKEIASKIGKKKAYELLDMVEGNQPFVAEVKIKKSGIKSKKEEITLKENQKIILEYIED